MPGAGVDFEVAAHGSQFLKLYPTSRPRTFGDSRAVGEDRHIALPGQPDGYPGHPNSVRGRTRCRPARPRSSRRGRRPSRRPGGRSDDDSGDHACAIRGPASKRRIGVRDDGEVAGWDGPAPLASHFASHPESAIAARRTKSVESGEVWPGPAASQGGGGGVGTWTQRVERHARGNSRG